MLDITESQRLEALAICEQMQATITRIQAASDAMMAAVEEWRADALPQQKDT